MYFCEIKPPAGVTDGALALSYLRESYGQVIEAGFLDFRLGSRGDLWLETKDGGDQLSIITSHLAQKGFEVFPVNANKPMAYPLSSEWEVRVNLKLRGNRSKFEKIDKVELEQEFPDEIAKGIMRIRTAKSKNLFFVTFNGHAIPSDFRQRLEVIGQTKVSEARPAHFYYGSKVAITI